MANNIQQCIQRLPLSTIKRLQLMCAYHSATKPINKLLNRNKVINEIPFEPLIYSNKLYGNEYLLHLYAGIDFVRNFNHLDNDLKIETDPFLARLLTVSSLSI